MGCAATEGERTVVDAYAAARGGTAEMALNRRRRAEDFENHVGSDQKCYKDQNHQRCDGGE